MVKVCKVARFALVVLSIVLFTVLGTSCVSTGNPIDNNDYNPPVSILEQPESSNINICVNKTKEASFSIPVIVDVDLSMFNTNTAISNNKLYVTDIKG